MTTLPDELTEVLDWCVTGTPPFVIIYPITKTISPGPPLEARYDVPWGPIGLN